MVEFVNAPDEVVGVLNGEVDWTKYVVKANAQELRDAFGFDDEAAIGAFNTLWQKGFISEVNE